MGILHVPWEEEVELQGQKEESGDEMDEEINPFLTIDDQGRI